MICVDAQLRQFSWEDAKQQSVPIYIARWQHRKQCYGISRKVRDWAAPIQHKSF